MFSSLSVVQDAARMISFKQIAPYGFTSIFVELPNLFGINLLYRFSICKRQKSKKIEYVRNEVSSFWHSEG